MKRDSKPSAPPLIRPSLTRKATFLPEDEWDGISRSLRFSQREREIVRMVLCDEPEVQIAAELGISSHTVHSHMARIYAKTKTSSRCQLVAAIFETYVRLFTRDVNDQELRN